MSGCPSWHPGSAAFLRSFRTRVEAILVPPGEPAALAQAITRLGSDPELRDRLGRQAKLRSSMFDIAEANRAVGDIYLLVAGSR